MDEVPTQAPDFIVSLSIALDSDLTANLIDALTRGAGEGTVSVGSRCPRRKFRRRGSARRGTPPSSPHKAPAPIPMTAMGFAPPALVKGSDDSPCQKQRTGESTKSGAYVGTSSTAIAVPLPLIGEGLSAR